MVKDIKTARLFIISGMLTMRAVDRLVGLVVKASAPRAADPDSIPAFSMGILSGPNTTSDSENGTLVATLPGHWRYWLIT